MADQWYYARNNKKHGPLTGQQLKQTVAAGQLQPTDMVWKEGMQKWIPASSIKGLFQTAQAAPAETPRAAEPRQPRAEHHAPVQVGTAAGSYDEASPGRSSRKTIWLVAPAYTQMKFGPRADPAMMDPLDQPGDVGNIGGSPGRRFTIKDKKP